MAAVEMSSRASPQMVADDLDGLFDHDLAHVFRDIDTNIDAPSGVKDIVDGSRMESRDSLGLDEEVKVAKKRAPVPKLDENRLLSPAGIPKLRRITKDRLTFKGKGHEYSDIARLLNTYQLWLDDLYPRAKFADALAIIEKLGHSKRMQTMRKEWIRESKPRETLVIAEGHTTKAEDQGGSSRHPFNEIALASRLERPESIEANRLAGTRVNASEESLFVSEDEEPIYEELPDDDLDVLLAEDEAEGRTGPVLQIRPDQRNQPSYMNFDDDIEAMTALDEMW